MLKYVKRHGVVNVIRDAIHDEEAKTLFNAFVIATTQRLSEVDYSLLVEEIINIFEDEQRKGEKK